MATVPLPTNYPHVVHPPGGGEPVIDGLRIRVRDVVLACDQDGLTPEEIVASVYPILTLGQVYAALAYYEDHREVIETAEQHEAQAIQEFKRANPDAVIEHTADGE